MWPRTSNCGGASSQTGYVEIDPSGRYGRFREMLGKGAMKTVYKGFDKVLGIEVAWCQVMLSDVLRFPDELQRLYSEVHLLKNLNHESIIRFHHSWIDVDQRTFNFITEMFTSGTLREYRQKHKEVDIRAIKNWARQILHGLVYLHSHDPPVIHRDLKCDNIFVNGHLGQVKIGDLGLAAILRGSQHAHSVIGTPEFMAPEVYEEQYDELIDVYSFGMCVLEMLTSEYPYSECSNPAQIYKKVTLGKKPEAFHRIQDKEAQRFVGKCLETASKRLPAHELLLDPFLAASEDAAPVSKPPLQVYSPKGVIVGMPFLLDNPVRSTEMTITGTMNPEDDTLFLKVQISDKNGHVRNVHFPFDIINDKAMEVAMEMVKELEITDWDPYDIAEMIEVEISALVPEWKVLGLPKDLQQHCFDYAEDDDDENRPPYLPCYSPSHDSVQGLSDSYVTPFSHENASRAKYDQPQGHLVNNNDDLISESSYSLGAYSDFDYRSLGKSDGYNSSPEETGERISDMKTDRCKTLTRLPSEKRNGFSRKLGKIGSFKDLRSQLLQRALNKRRAAKTIGAVENIGFHDPC